MQSTFQVKGMTCGHCVNAVTQEMLTVEGVEAVDVDLDSGTVSVKSAAALDETTVRAAIDEAGYELVGGVTSA